MGRAEPESSKEQGGGEGEAEKGRKAPCKAARPHHAQKETHLA